MKYLIMILALTVSTAAFAKKEKMSKPEKKWSRPYGMAGCGLGSIVMGKHGGQISAATTNGTSGSQTFGITTGTSNCVDGPAEQMAQKMDNYIMTNKVALASDIAQGNGENLSVIAEIMKCSNQAQFNSAMKNNFSNIFVSEKVNHMEVTDAIINTVLDDAFLSQNCAQGANIVASN